VNLSGYSFGFTQFSIMSENLHIIQGTAEEQYEHILPQIKALLSQEDDLIAALANTAAALHMQFNWLWTGFYLKKGDELVLGPFQGPIACSRIAFGRGVCGSAWQQARTIIVPDVEQFPGHIACSSRSRSEIVVPVIRKGNVVAVLDVDSEERNSFNETDAKYLERLTSWLPF